MPSPTAGAGGTSTFFLTNKRCNTPFSADFTAALATDNIALQCSGQGGLGESQKTNFAPRVGFAYQITPKLVVRGGYGIFYGGFENSALLTYAEFPFQFNLDFPNQVPNAPITFADGAIGTIESGLTHIPLTSAAAEPGGVGFIGEDFKNKTPNTQGYNLTLQYQLAANDTLQVGYVGNTVHHLAVYTNPNTPREILPLGLDSLAFSPYPDFSGATYTQFAGNSHYNGLQVNYEHRFNAGLSVLGNFTWSNCMTNAPDVLNATAITGFRAAYLPGWGINKDFGRCDFDINKVVHLSGIYELPIGRGKHFLHDSSGVVNAVLGGWVTNWILTSAERPTRHDSVRNQHDVRLRLLRDQSARSESVRGSAQREPVAERRGFRDAAGGDDDRADGFQPARRRPGPIRWSWVPPVGLLALQAVPAHREVPPGVPFGIL